MDLGIVNNENEIERILRDLEQNVWGLKSSQSIIGVVPVLFHLLVGLHLFVT